MQIRVVLLGVAVIALVATWRSGRDSALHNPISPQSEVPSSTRSTSVSRAVETVVSPAAIGHASTFNGRTFTASADAAHRLVDAAAHMASGTTLPVFIGLKFVPRPDERAELRTKGIALLAYVPDHGWIARISRDLDAAWCLRSVDRFQSLDADLRTGPGVLQPCECDLVPLRVHVLPDRTAAMCAARWSSAGWSLSAHQAGPFSYVAARVARSEVARFVATVAADADVLLVEAAGGARLLNDNSMRILQSGSYTSATPVFARGIFGSNQVIAVCDTGIDIDSCYFRDATGSMPPFNTITGTNVDWNQRKVIAADFLYPGDNPLLSSGWDNFGHGTHVAGHACASSVFNPLGTFSLNGMAPAARLVVQDGGFTSLDNCADLVGLGCPVTNFFPALLQAYAQGARIHNNSWGDNENAVFAARNEYTQASRDLDAAVWSNRDLLVVCAAGNDGADDQVLSPSNAKNGLSVAATEGGAAADSVAGFSSRGWAADGRVKPDLAAPGNNVIASTSDGQLVTSNCTTSGGGGTSYASPMIAGLAALVRDYFAQGFYPSSSPVASNAVASPSAAMVKAMLVAACRGMTNVAVPPPSRAQGWGRPWLGEVLAFTDTVHRLVVKDAGPRFSATPALPFTTWLNIRSTNAPLKVVLAWTDFPGTPGAGKQLINDLDLVVRGSNFTYRGNVLSGGESVVGSWYDRTNNIEQVFVPSPVTGLVEVSVWASVVVEATQDFALVASGDLEEIPKDRDEDADGLPDYWELWRHGALTHVDANSDLDGDWCSEFQECVAGTDPNDASSRFAISGVFAETSGIAVTFPVVAGRAYALSEGSNDAARLVAGTPESAGTQQLVATNLASAAWHAIRVTAP